MTSKLRLDIPVLLPELSDVADACVKRLTADLEARQGVERVHVVAADGEEPAKLCLHYDPEILPLVRIREIARTSGARITARFGHLTWNVSGIGHERRARTVVEKLRSSSGILEAEASAAGIVHIEFDRKSTSEDSIASSLRDLGVKRMSDTSLPAAGKQDEHAGHDHGAGEHSQGDGDDHAHGEFLGPNTELIFALASGGLLAIGYAIERLLTGAPDWLPTACYIAAYFFGGFFTLREAIDNLRLRRFEIDTLMLVAAAGAAALGAFAEGALLLFLFSLGHALEHYAMGRAKRAIEALAELAPPVATVRRASETTEIPVEELVRDR
jgi:Cd2+/Zn2+-exporting ATPase